MPSENAEALERAAMAIEATAHVIAEGGEDDGIANPEECARDAISGYLKAMEEAGFVMVPVEPTDELLMSMAVRYDHALAEPGYYDQPILARPGVTHAKMLDATLTSMRQVHEEVVGTGFYSTETAPRYRAMLSAKDADGREG